MGNNLSNNAGGLSLNERMKGRRSNKNWFRVDPVVLSKEDVEEIMEDGTQKPGTYVVYEDQEREKTCLAVKMATGQVAHHAIKKLNDLYYFNDFPFPYLESIILYYQRHKFRGTKFTQQAFVSPYVTAQRCKRLTAKSSLRSEGNHNKKHVNQDVAGTWSYGQYKQFHQFQERQMITNSVEEEERTMAERNIGHNGEDGDCITPI